jgi:uncharacterized protein (DUF362 family)
LSELPAQDGDQAHQLNRREFLRRAAKAGVAIAAAGGAAWWYGASAAPPAQPPPRGLFELGDFSLRDGGPRLAIVTGADRARTASVAFQALGGVGRFIRRGDRVLLKVNAAFASPPMLGATTHPDLVGQVARLCLSAGAAAVIVTDNPINDPASCFALTGIGPAAASAGAKVVLPRDGAFRPFTLPGGRLIRDWPVLAEPFGGVSKLIGLAPLKHHERSGASMTMKNWYGLLGGRRNTFHQDIHGIIRELAVMVRPTLVILDATTTMMRNGPTGGSLDDLKATHTLIAGTDQVAVDAFGATLLGKTLDDLPHIRMAGAAGAGTADWASLSPRRAEASP